MAETNTFGNKNRKMKLIADSGSTKTAWGFLADGSSDIVFETAGINPVRDSETAISKVITALCERAEVSAVTEIFFYGAGCISPYSHIVEHVLQSHFPTARVHVESDLLGAARALCGHDAGIACILGTGSNSCYYDGNRIVENVSPLGWILGDEGSGAVLGRLLVGDVLKRQFPAHICDAFQERYNLSRANIIEAVYRSPQPNRFLASLVPFLSEHAADASIHSFLVREFQRFFVRNVASYGRRNLLVHFVGGLAAHFVKELSEAADNEGFKIGIIESSPIQRMMSFHRTY